MKQRPFARRVATVGLLAGLAGGLAEVAWISVYAAMTGSNAALVARAVSDTVVGETAFPIVNGVGIHMGLAAMLGICIAFALHLARRHRHGFNEYAVVVPALLAVWAFNFFVVLPLINPHFVQVVPYAASLISKLLFGVAAAWSLQAARTARVPTLIGS